MIRLSSVGKVGTGKTIPNRHLIHQALARGTNVKILSNRNDYQEFAETPGVEFVENPDAFLLRKRLPSIPPPNHPELWIVDTPGFIAPEPLLA